MGGKANVTPEQASAGKAEMKQKYGTIDLTPSYMKAPAYATGGIITKPHLGLVGEAGREAIIPLEDKSSGLSMLMSAVNELGVSNEDILPYITPTEPALNPMPASPVVNVSPAIPAVNVPQMQIPAPAVNVSPVVMPADVNVQTPSIPPLDMGNISNAIMREQFAALHAMQTDIISATPTDLFNNIIQSIERLSSQNRLAIPPAPSSSSPILIQHTQNQAAMAGQATAQAQAQSPDKPVNVNSQVEVNIESKPVEIYLDSERVGSVLLRWLERRNVRNGMSEF